MEAQGANSLFPFMLPNGAQAAGIDVEALWLVLRQLADPGPAPTIAVPDLPPSNEAIRVGAPNRAAKPIAAFVSIAAFIVGLVIAPKIFWLFGIGAFALYGLVAKGLSKEGAIGTFKTKMLQAEANHKSVQDEWERQAGGSTFNDAKNTFARLKNDLDLVPQKRIAALNALKDEQRNRQLQRFLENFQIEDAQIEAIGPGRKRLLASYGVEAADDIVVSRLQNVPGFGVKMIERLVKWRRSIEAKFVFDPSKGNDPRDIARIEQDILALRQKIEISLRDAQLRAIQVHTQLIQTRWSKKTAVEESARNLGQARSDYNFLSGK